MDQQFDAYDLASYVVAQLMTLNLRPSASAVADMLEKQIICPCCQKRAGKMELALFRLRNGTFEIRHEACMRRLEPGIERGNQAPLNDPPAQKYFLVLAREIAPQQQRLVMAPA